MQSVKLVIWDLDETFWKGTLSEEGITPIDKNIEIIKDLTSRGIINSICSKNDYSMARDVLQELGVWEYFVFPAISWDPKGPKVKMILDQFQLRAENALFLDDNHLNLEEVKYYNNGILAESPEYIHDNIDQPHFSGKEDAGHIRLKQYKILEEKWEVQKKYTSNRDFLRDSEIKINIIYELNTLKERVLELINRTNQLNFTKNRIDDEELIRLLENDKSENFAVQVHDRFGDYGICGFVSYDRNLHKLHHFLFSCRIMNLGIEQFLYDKLNHPELKVSGEVATLLKGEYSDIDWITEEKTGSGKMSFNGYSKNEKSEKKLLIIGSCDLHSTVHYLEGYSENIKRHMVGSGEYNMLDFPDHLVTLINKFKIKDQKILNELDELPFLSKRHSLSGHIFEEDYDLVIYGVLANYGQHVYRHKKHGYRIAWGLYDYVLTDKSPNSKILNFLKNQGMPSPEQFILEFSSAYEHEGFMSPDSFIQHLKEFRSLIPDNVPIVFINGAEFNPDPLEEKQAEDRHKSMNRALDNYLSNAKNCYLLDMRSYVKGLDDMGKDIRHFQRPIYKQLSDGIIDLLNKEFGVETKSKAYFRYYYYKKQIIKSIVFNRFLNNRATRTLYRKLKSL